MKKTTLPVILTLLSCCSLGVKAQDIPDFSGMWSDPPDTLEGTLCFFVCFENSTDILYGLLDDPANDDIPALQLTQMAMGQAMRANIFPKLTPAAREHAPRDQSKDPGFTECEPWGFAREIFAPHQLKITQHPGHIEMQYGEWDITRTVYMKDGAVPENPGYSQMGFSVAHYEGDTLVIETINVNANIFFPTYHSNQLTAVERYHKSDDGQVLNLATTFTDPETLTEPLTIKKIWSWAPDQEIFAYDSCVIPDPDLIVEGV